MRKTFGETAFIWVKEPLNINSIIMKRNLIISLFLLLFISISCTSPKLMYVKSEKYRFRLSQHGETWYSENYIPQRINKDSTYNILLVDSIYLNLDSCLVITLDFNNQFLLFTNNSGEDILKNKKGFKSFFDSPNCYLLYFDTFMYWLGPVAKKSEPALNRPKGCLNRDYPRRKMKGSYFWIREYQERPKFFLLFLIRGDVYNSTTMPIDGAFHSVYFKDKKAYYKVLVPVWESRDGEVNK